MNKIRIMICCAVFLMFLGINALFSMDNFIEILSKSSKNHYDFKETVETIQTDYVDSYDFKNQFIDLNGLYARLSGRRLSNERILLNNDMLIHEIVKKIDTEPLSNELIKFDQLLNEMNIDFLYVQAPYKLDLEETLLPEGIENNAHENASEMINALIDANVDVLDLRVDLNQDAQAIDLYFNLTDHHWNNDGAFEAFRLIMNQLVCMYPEQTFEKEYLNEQMWTREVYENLFLGSHGKRVGRYFAGVDDLILYTPAFETEMTTYSSKTNTFLSGTFDEVNVVSSFLEEDPDYYGKNHYHVYIGNNYPLYQHRNKKVDNDLKVLILKDSFVLPVQAFLSTEVASLDVIDPRYYTESSIMEYIDCTQPDVVMMMINPSVFVEEEYFDLGLDDVDVDKTYERISVAKYDFVEMESQNFGYNSFKILGNLKSDCKYSLTVKDIDLLKGDSDSVTVSVYDHDLNQTYLQRAIDLKQLDEDGFKLSFYTPDNCSENCELLIFAGVKGKTHHVSLQIHEMELFEYKE